MSCRRSTPLEPGETLEVIGKVRHADLDASAGDADGAHDEAHAVLLSGEDMLDRRTHGGSLRIGSGDALRHRPARWLLLVDMTGEHALGEERLVLLRPVGRIGPDPGAGVVLADHVGQPCAVVSIGGTRPSYVDAPLLTRRCRID